MEFMTEFEYRWADCSEVGCRGCSEGDRMGHMVYTGRRKYYRDGKRIFVTKAEYQALVDTMGEDVDITTFDVLDEEFNEAPT